MKVKVFLVLCMSLMMLSACSNALKNDEVLNKTSDVSLASEKKKDDTELKNEKVIENEIIKENESNLNIKQEVKQNSVKQSSNKSNNNQTSNNQSNVVKEEPKQSEEHFEEETKKEENPVINAPIVEQKPNEPSKPAPPSVACPNGKDPSIACDVILDTNYYFMTFASEEEAINQGQYYLDEVVYLNDLEITNYSTQAVYRNDHSIAYYGLNFWSNGTLIQ